MDRKIDVYQKEIPDTFDLAHRAELALNGLAGGSDPDGGFLMYFSVFWRRKNYPHFMHQGQDLECAPKWLDDYQLMRVASGSEEYLEYENGLCETVLKSVYEKDGLFYNTYDPKRPWHLEYLTMFGYEPVKEDLLSINMSGNLMSVLQTRGDLTGGGYDKIINGLGRGIIDCAVVKGDYAYCPEDFATSDPEKGFIRIGGPFSRLKGKPWHTDKEPYDEHSGAEGSVVAYFGHQARSLASWAERTQNEEYLEFAGRFARFIMKPNFWGNKTEPVHVCGKERGFIDSHPHSRGQALRGVLEYGLVAGDERACNFVRDSYEYMRLNGIPLIGWTNCFLQFEPNEEAYRSMEGCFIGDKLAMMIKLSDGGYGDYWDEIEKLARNMLAEAQFTDEDRIRRAMANLPEDDKRPVTYADVNMKLPGDIPPSRISFDNFVPRMIGNFSSNIGITSSKYDLFQCCTCNAVRGIYYAWEGITRQNGDDATVNMFLNRASPWLDIDSWLPYEGKVAVTNKTARRISIRMPGYMDLSKLICRLNGEIIRQRFIGRRLVVDWLKPGDVIMLEFPLKEETYHFTAHAKTGFDEVYAILMKANTVLDISPRDDDPTAYHFFLREGMKASKAPMKTVTRRVYPIIPGV